MLTLKLDTRKKLEIYDPAMCCPTGLCGVNVDPELIRISLVIDNLKKKGIVIDRYNLKDHPQIFVDNKVVNDCLMNEAVDALPIITLGGEIVMTRSYPSNEQISDWMGIEIEELAAQ